MELLLTKPIGIWNLVWGKFLGAFLLTFIALVPSLLYVYTVYELGNPVGNLDIGATLGSYLGLLLLAASYTAIGIFTSALSSNQITAFIFAVFICFIGFFASEGITDYRLLDSTYGIEFLGMSYHYNSMSRGVIDTRDLIYFLSLICLFLFLTWYKVASLKNKN